MIHPKPKTLEELSAKAVGVLENHWKKIPQKLKATPDSIARKHRRIVTASLEEAADFGQAERVLREKFALSGEEIWRKLAGALNDMRWERMTLNCNLVQKFPALEMWDLLEAANKNTYRAGQWFKITSQNQKLPVLLTKTWAEAALAKMLGDLKLTGKAALEMTMPSSIKTLPQGWTEWALPKNTDDDAYPVACALSHECAETGWCLADLGVAKDYLESGRIHTYRNRQGKTTAAIYEPDNDSQWAVDYELLPGENSKEYRQDLKALLARRRGLGDALHGERARAALRKELAELAAAQNHPHPADVWAGYILVPKGRTTHRAIDQNGNLREGAESWAETDEFKLLAKRLHLPKEQRTKKSQTVLKTAFDSRSSGIVVIPYKVVREGIYCPNADKIWAPNLVATRHLDAGNAVEIRAPKLRKCGRIQAPKAQITEMANRLKTKVAKSKRKRQEQ